jgi:hypothetical protein
MGEEPTPMGWGCAGRAGRGIGAAQDMRVAQGREPYGERTTAGEAAGFVWGDCPDPMVDEVRYIELRGGNGPSEEFAKVSEGST